MTLMIDTNVVLDVLLRRRPFFEDSYQTLRFAIGHKIDCYVSATAVTDIFYLLRKYLQDPSKAKKVLSDLTLLISIADVQDSDIHTALSSDLSDYEDAVVATIAARIKADAIITRDSKGFSSSAVPALSPSEFLKKHHIDSNG